MHLDMRRLYAKSLNQLIFTINFKAISREIVNHKHEGVSCPKIAVAKFYAVQF